MSQRWNRIFWKILTDTSPTNRPSMPWESPDKGVLYAWLLEFDIKGLFDHIDHDLLMKAVCKHTEEKWEILYIERWLKAPFEKSDGTVTKRESGPPQGGVISPVLANQFMHYAFDKWMQREYPQNPWARYADDGIVYCKTLEEAETILKSLEKRLLEIKLEIHPEKTRIVYCKNKNRDGSHPNEKFDFLGYTFRARLIKSRDGEFFTGFTPAISDQAKMGIRRKLREMKIQFMTSLELKDLSKVHNPKIRGGINYYVKFCPSEMNSVLKYIKKVLLKWVMSKYKKCRRSKAKARKWLVKIAKTVPKLFVHWEKGIIHD